MGPSRLGLRAREAQDPTFRGPQGLLLGRHLLLQLHIRSGLCEGLPEQRSSLGWPDPILPTQETCTQAVSVQVLGLWVTLRPLRAPGCPPLEVHVYMYARGRSCEQAVQRRTSQLGSKSAGSPLGRWQQVSAMQPGSAAAHGAIQCKAGAGEDPGGRHDKLRKTQYARAHSRLDTAPCQGSPG